MIRSRCAALAAALAVCPLPAQASVRPGVPVAKVAYASDSVELAAPGKGWQQIPEGHILRTGDRLRTGEAVATLEFPFHSFLVGPGATLSVPLEVVLSTRLDDGRLEAKSEEVEMPRILTPEAEIRGAGHVIVRRSEGRTMVSVLRGQFRVQAEGRTVEAEEGTGVVVRQGNGPGEPQALPAVPTALSPGEDTLYLLKGGTVNLAWASPAPRHHVQMLAVGTALDQVLLAREAEAPPVTLPMRWLGTFRWRISSIDENGLEGPLSPEGFVCVVDE